MPAGTVQHHLALSIVPLAGFEVITEAVENRNPDRLPIAIRIYPVPETAKPPKAPRKWTRPGALLVLDTETRIDASQRLTFGSYRFFIDRDCIEERIFFADDLPNDEYQIIEQYVRTHNTNANSTPKLKVLKRKEFLNKIYRAAYKGRCLLVAFNLPFDASRVAFDWTVAKGKFAGGFSLELWSYIDPAGSELPNPQCPRLCVKHIDSKRALKGLTGRNKPDPEDLIPEGSETGEPDPKYVFPGHLLDLRTLAFALTDSGHTLESACAAFGVEHSKEKVKRHGIVTPEYIDYNRRDVLITSELAFKLLEEYEKHPVKLAPTQAYSPASIGKAYLRAMGIQPVLERQPDFPKHYLGYAETAFFGGRTSVHIRKAVVPIVYTDFLSMYPTVNSLMNLWSYVIAREITVIDHCQSEMSESLSKLKPADLFNPATWKRLCGFVKLIPNADILPLRAKYSGETNDWQVGINYVYAGVEDHTAAQNDGALWYSLPDVVASVILTGKVPTIVDALRVEAVGMLDGLKPIKLRGEIDVDPTREDLFRVAIEQRRRVAVRGDLEKAEKDRLTGALKVLANATSYGIYAEMNREESDKLVNVTCHGLDEEPYRCTVQHPDKPGRYCFPPFASLITAGARLMLALLEYCVGEFGGTYAMEDTDSMAIVATETGGMVPCPGGRHRTDGGWDAVYALSWSQVSEIRDRFAALNPYDQSAVSGSILKIEDDNFEPETKSQRQLFCYAISAKRYALFLRDDDGKPILLRKDRNSDKDHWKQHGLGHLLNPIDPESDDRDWIAQVWLNMIRSAEGLPAQKVPFEDLPAVGRISVSSPGMMKAFTNLNQGKEYSDQIKPFNFLLTSHLAAFGAPIGIDDPKHFHLVAPYESDSRKWLTIPWIDLYSGGEYRITTEGLHGLRNIARVKTYGDIMRRYAYHPEAKCADMPGNACGRETIGLLQRRHIRVDSVTPIGKESNKLEDVDAGLIHSAEEAYTTYTDPKRSEWVTKILPALKKAPLALLVKESGMSKRALMDIRAGRSTPHAKNQELLAEIVRKLRLA
jgi:hypothetical protein